MSLPSQPNPPFPGGSQPNGARAGFRIRFFKAGAIRRYIYRQLRLTHPIAADLAIGINEQATGLVRLCLHCHLMCRLHGIDVVLKQVNQTALITIQRETLQALDAMGQQMQLFLDEQMQLLDMYPEEMTAYDRHEENVPLMQACAQRVPWQDLVGCLGGLPGA